MPDAVTLPTNVRPVKYHISLEPDLGTFTFRGDERIDVEVVEPTSTIVLNAVGLGISSAQSVQEGGQTLGAQEIALDKPSETARLEFGQTIARGKAQLHLQFTGELSDRLLGFYRSRYRTSQGEERWLATTQFEPADARRAFPCWDEPSLKAIFAVILVIPSHLVALSNTPAVSEEETGRGTKAVRFAETPRMSTYLLAFVVGDLACVQETAADGTLVRVWATRGKEEQGRFALETAVKLLGYFNGYFGIPYPLPKLDHIAIPDYPVGAMENWGAITYGERALLVDPEHSSAATKQRVAEIVAHEMAHMWFGDLVTMSWWNDLWLNESFASWMGTKAVAHLYPEWNMWTQFVNHDTAAGLGLDGLKNSHPIEADVKSPAQISELFDAISYSKGASIIRMLEQFLGPETFRRGIHHYLSAHSYGNARTSDLWAALEGASGQPLASMMDSWVKQVGYPVLEVEARREGSRLELHLSQKRFSYSHLLEQGEPDQALWHIPVGVVTSWRQQPAFWLMDQRQTSVQLEGVPEESGVAWIKANVTQSGFYRTNYRPDDWEALIPAIGSRILPAADRLGLQDDAYALCRAGYLPVTQFLAIAEAYREEEDASVWSDLSANLGDLNLLIFEEPYYERYREFARGLFQLLAQRVGWEARPGEGHLQALLRSTVLGQVGRYGDSDTLSQARANLQSYLKDARSVHPDIRGVVFTLAAQGGDEATYRVLRDLEGKATLQEEKGRLLVALTNFAQGGLLQETLEFSLTPQVRHHDTITMVASVASNPHGMELAWEFLKAQWPEFDRRYGQGGFGLMRLVATTRHFSTRERLEEVEQFFRDHLVPAAERTVRQCLEQIQLNIRWLERNRPLLASRFGG